MYCTIPAMDTTAVDARTGAAGDEVDAQTCLYCANLKVLRDLLPPKRCDYVRPMKTLASALSHAVPPSVGYRC